MTFVHSDFGLYNRSEGQLGGHIECLFHRKSMLQLYLLFLSCAVGVICAAPGAEGAWWRAQVITFYKETSEVEIRYVDYGGYDRVKVESLRQIR